MFPPLRGGGHEQLYSVMKGGKGGGEGGTQNVRPAIFPFCSHPSPIINDRSLSDSS